MRRDRSPLPALLLLAALLASPAVASAQPMPAQPTPAQSTPPAQPTPAPSVEPKTADEYALEGRKLAMQPGRLLDARAALLTAWSMRQSFDTAGNLGSVEFELGMMRDAAEHLSFCVRNFPSVRDEAQTEKLARVEQLLRKAKTDVGSVRVRVADPDGVELTGATVLVDGKEVGRTPLQDDVFVEPGARVISARLPGLQPTEKSVQAAKGGTENVTLTLAPVKEQVISRPPVPEKPVPAKKSGALIAVGAGAAAAFLGAGVGLHLVSNGKSGEATAAWDELRGAQNDRGACLNPANAARCDELRSAYDGRELFRGLAIGGYVAGGVLAVGTLVYALMPGGSSPTGAPREQGSPAAPAVRAFVSVAPGGGGAMIEGRF
jgi:hypothetical protein